LADLADPTARVTADGRLLFAGVTYRAALGRGGVRADKQEGDGATPAALLPLRRVFYRADRIAKPRTPLPIEPLARSDGWCDDPSHRAYNTHIALPFEARHEMLWRDDPLYDLCAVLGWNDAPVVRGRGSAIFLHLARPDYAPTEGCVALALPDLLTVLAAGLRALDIT
jgi:L,D-peptidoglycan transpeptidase YkuD (ErfK/YbiS/YcfS/YnhG family)